MPVTEELLNVKPAATILGIHADTLRRWANLDLIASVRTPTGYRKFRRSDLVLPTSAEMRARTLAQR